MRDPRDTWWLAGLAAVFLLLYFLPVGTARFDGAVLEALQLAKGYAREHVLLCLVPAFFIAGAIGVFVSQASVMKYLGPSAPRPVAYGVAAISGTVLAVCSCTVLPLFGGIYRRGAGLGPAAAFLYSGPAINALAMILTARVLGLELGLARAVGAVAASFLVGLAMAWLFRHEERDRALANAALPVPEPRLSLARQAIFFGLLVAVLIFANWAPAASGLWAAVFAAKWWLVAGAGAALLLVLVRWLGLARWKATAIAATTALAAAAAPNHPVVAFSVGFAGLAASLAGDEGELGEWLTATWEFAKQILPLLLGGVLVAGLLLGRPGHEGLVPSAWVTAAVGGNGFAANLFAAAAGALMYFATLTEIPILQGLLGSGMGQGPALALLLAGPALSLPAMLVLERLLGWRKTAAYVALVVAMATASGLLWGALASPTGETGGPRGNPAITTTPTIHQTDPRGGFQMTTRLQILGTGCPKCRLLGEHTERAARELGLDYQLEKVTDLEQILAFGVIATPALVVDGEIRVSGHVPSTGRLRELLAGSGVSAS
jgi:small redox-active disulfide protein 2